MSDSVSSYRDLTVWQKSMYLVTCVYQATKQLPKEEQYALTSQMRRASISIPSNIAEGAGRYNTKDYIHFLRIARGSNNELETQLLICEQLHYLSSEEVKSYLKLCDEINRMLNAMLLKLKAKA